MFLVTGGICEELSDVICVARLAAVEAQSKNIYLTYRFAFTSLSGNEISQLCLQDYIVQKNNWMLSKVVQYLPYHPCRWRCPWTPIHFVRSASLDRRPV